MVGLRKNFSRCRIEIYLDRSQRRMPNSRSSIEVSSSKKKEMNGQVKFTRRTLCNIAHSFMVHARVLEAYINFALMYMTDHIFPVLPIKYLINKDNNLTTLFKLSTGMKPSLSHLHVLFCPCAVQKSTAHVDKKALNMRHQAQKGFHVIFVGIIQHKKGYFCVSTKYKEDNMFIWCCFWWYFLVRSYISHNTT